jgi:hypothetical protein
MAKEVAASQCGGDNVEAVTSLAALGLLSDAIAAVNSPTCSLSPVAAHRWGMSRARALGRLAVAQKLSGSDADPELLRRAIRSAEEARRQGQNTPLFRPYDNLFVDTMCDLAQDYVIIGEQNSALDLVKGVNETPPILRFTVPWQACRNSISPV